MPKCDHPLIPEIQANFKEAERAIKQIERLGEGIAFPAVNQLRYVAYHLLRAASSNEKDFIDDELREALYHSHRALHDSSEIGIAYLLGLIRKFQDDYKMVTVTDIVPEYLDICKTANDAKEYITTRTDNSVKEHANNKKRGADEYDSRRFNLYFKLLYEYTGRLNIARIELNKKLKWKRYIVITSIITIALGILTLLISL